MSAPHLLIFSNTTHVKILVKHYLDLVVQKIASETRDENYAKTVVFEVVRKMVGIPIKLLSSLFHNSIPFAQERDLHGPRLDLRYLPKPEQMQLNCCQPCNAHLTWVALMLLEHGQSFQDSVFAHTGSRYVTLMIYRDVIEHAIVRFSNFCWHSNIFTQIFLD